MKTVFDKATRDELIYRINKLDKSSARQWGKMTVYQMVKHCALWEEMVLGGKSHKQVLIGRIFGKMALKKVMKDDSPLTRNTPTMPELTITDDGDIVAQKKRWIEHIEQYAHFSNEGFMHPFFGKMTREQVGYMAYKHTDHHLRQFSV